MLPSAHRMRSSAQFSSAVSHGQRVRRGNVVVHVCRADQPTVPTVGFVVGKSVGNSVVRHRVSRRLRAIVAARLTSLPLGSATVVRALPGAAQASSAALSADLDSAFARLVAGFRSEARP